MSNLKRPIMVGEELFLERKGGKIFFRSVAEPDADLMIDLGWAFEFSESVQHLGSTGLNTTSSRLAMLVATKDAGEFAATLDFDDGQRVLLEDVVPTNTLRVTRIPD
jgi:hypothetical protein